MSHLFRATSFLVGAGLLTGMANAQSFTGPGGAIPLTGTGGTGSAWPNTFPDAPLVSTVNVNVSVSSVMSVELTNLSHTWIGDLQVVLENPAGARFNVLYRPGSINGSVGSSGDPTGSPHIFVETGGLSVPVSGNVPAGTYDQHFGDWPNTTAVGNVPMSGITGAAGTWTLTIYDWASGDIGSLGSWTLNVNGSGPPPPSTYCTAKTTSNGCVPSIGFTGTATPGGNLVATCSQVEVSQLGVLFYGINGGASISFQDGFLCVAPPVTRFPFTNSGGSALCSGTYSRSLDSLTGTPGMTFHTQFWFRDPGAASGTGLSNGLTFVTY